MESSTRQQLVSAAERLFAARGFYGTSIAAIAAELGLTKQALLHHFASKEKLYGEVLQTLSDRLAEETRVITASSAPPECQVEDLVLAQYRGQMRHQDSARLIMRELLDNEPRAAGAETWYLKPYLETLLAGVLACPAQRDLDPARALALVYQLLGAAHYFAVSQPTLERMFGPATMDGTRNCFESELRRLIRARLAA